MCFSASASFMTGAPLTLIGILSLSYARSLKERMFAAIPFFFGIQQIAEGIVWKGIEFDNPIMIKYGALSFLFFAFFFWPIWVPLTMNIIEPNQKRKQVLQLFLILGAALGTYLMYCIFMYGITVELVQNNIKYSSNFNQYELLGTIIYLIVTTVPFFIVPNPILNLMGIAIALSYIAAYFLYLHALISVWCFFVAIISFFSIYFIYSLHQKPVKKTSKKK